MDKHVTTRDIAREVGLHHTTVSLALRDSPLLKADTKRRIQEVADRLGYKPDPMLNALSVYRLANRQAPFQAVIAWINNWKDQPALLENPTYRAYFEGACNCARRLGYDLQEFWMHEPGMSGRKLQSILKARSIQGMLLPPQNTPGIKLDIDYSDFFVVAFGYSMQPSNLHLVTNHHAQTLDLLMANLVELGYHRPGYWVNASADKGTNYIWLTRLLYLTERYPNLIQIPRAPTQKKEIERWLRKYKPDVIIGFNTVLEEVESFGCKVPEDIGFASLAVDLHNSKISGVNENDFLIGQTAVNVLVGMIHHHERGIPSVPIRTLVDSVWFPGETLRQQPMSSGVAKTAKPKSGRKIVIPAAP